MSGHAADQVVHGAVIAVGGAFLAALAISSFSGPRTGSSRSPAGGAATGSAAPAASRASLHLTTEDFRFAPTSLGVAPGAAVTLAVQNTGAVTHSFTADSPAVSVDVAAGQTQNVSFTAPASGGMAFYCRFHPGMQGTVTVGASPPGG
ncbi:MAG: cupredoxin domain-containing protein [Candidatus Dormibacteria bacterium]